MMRGRLGGTAGFIIPALCWLGCDAEIFVNHIKGD